MAMFAASPSTVMDSTTVGGLRRRPPIVVEAAMVDGKAAHIAIEVIPDESHPRSKLLFSGKSYEIESLIEDTPDY